MNVFIQKIRSHPMLWDVNDILFRDITQKSGAWERIAAECGMSNGEEARTVWKKLRCSYREAMRRRSIDKSLPAWKYENLMNFLAQPPQNDTSTFTENAENDESEDENIAIVKVEHDIEVSVDDPSLQRDDDISFHNVDSSIDSKLTKQMRLMERGQSARNTLSSPIRIREQLRDDREKQRREIRKSQHDWNRVEQSDMGNDALTNLFTSLCQKTRQLPKYLQLVVQREIFEVVIKAEEEALANDGDRHSLDAPNKLD